MKTHLDLLKDIISNDLCTRCGSCSGICPHDVIAPDKDFYPSWDARRDRCNDCGLCVRICPGVIFSFPEHYRTVFQKTADAQNGHGHFIKAFLGYSTDPHLRDQSTSGGIATALPIFLLRQGRITGAFAVRSDPVHPWKPLAFIARSEDELHCGKQSKYPACSMNHLIRDLHKEKGSFLYTGIPCQIHGLRKMATISKKIDGKIGLVVGLACHSCLDHQALRDMLEYYRLDEQNIARFTYRSGKLPGYIRAKTSTDQSIGLPYPQIPLAGYRPNAKECLTLLFKLYSPLRCRLCIDATSEFADISIGDPWVKGWQGMPHLKNGYNLILARTERGLRVLEEAREAGLIVLEPFPESSVLLAHTPMIRGKRMLAFYNIERRTQRGKISPEYYLNKKFSQKERISAALHASTYFASNYPSLRKQLVHFLLSPMGRFVVFSLFFRRHVVQDMIERTKAFFKKNSLVYEKRDE